MYACMVVESTTYTWKGPCARLVPACVDLFSSNKVNLFEYVNQNDAIKMIPGHQSGRGSTGITSKNTPDEYSSASGQPEGSRRSLVRASHTLTWTPAPNLDIHAFGHPLS